jgi:hypothetical protein
MEAKVDKVGGYFFYERKARTMSNAKGKTKIFQYPKGLMAEPGFIPELKGMTMEFGTREG